MFFDRPSMLRDSMVELRGAYGSDWQSVKSREAGGSEKDPL
jgi:hypothetical protein